MSKQSLQSVSIDELAVFTDYLSKGGTLGQLSRIKPSALEATYSMAYHQYQSGQYEEAARAFQYLCFYSHWNPRYFLCLGACQKMLGVYGQAIRTFQYVVWLDPDNPLPLAYIGDCYRLLKDYARARQAYRGALDLASRNKFEHQEIARIKNILSFWGEEEGESSKDD